MTDVFHQGDTSPSFGKTIRNELGEVVDLTGVTDISFRMRDDDYNVIINDNIAGNVEVTDAATGKVQYNWQAGDTDNLGSYDAEFEVEFSDGGIETYPKYGFYRIEIIGDIA